MVPVRDDERDVSGPLTGGTGGGPRVLYPVFDSREERTFERALDIAAGANAELLVLDLVDGRGPGVDDADAVDPAVPDTGRPRGVEVRSLVEPTTQPVETVAAVARRHDARLAVFDEHTPDTLTGVLRGDVSQRVSSRSPCDAVTVAHSPTVERVASILVPVADGAHSRLAVSVAGALALGTDAVVELFHVSDPTADRAESAVADPLADDLFARARERLPEAVDVDTWHLEREDVAAAIVEQSRHYDVTVIGRPDRGLLRRFVAGSVAENVRSDADNTVLTVRSSDGPGFDVERR